MSLHETALSDTADQMQKNALPSANDWMPSSRCGDRNFSPS